MLSQKEYERWLGAHSLEPKARELMSLIRSSEPVRRVGPSTASVCGRYPSTKMGRTIQFESHTVELGGIYEMEYDAEVLEYYDQPSKILLAYSQDGRRRVVQHTPDFFVIRRDSAGWEEWKDAAELGDLAGTAPGRYQLAGQDWVCPPGQSYAAEYGLYYRVRSSAQLNGVYLRNLRFLEDYLLDSKPVPQAASERIVRTVRSAEGIRLKELVTRLDQGWVDHVYALIAVNQLYCDLRSQALASTDSVRVFTSAGMCRAANLIESVSPAALVGTGPIRLEAGASLEWDGVSGQVLNVGETSVFISVRGQTVAITHSEFESMARSGKITGAVAEVSGSVADGLRELAEVSPTDLRIMCDRYEIVQAYFRGDVACSVPLRTIQRWARLCRDAESSTGCGILGLRPSTSSRGNRLPRLSQDTHDMMRTIIEKEYETIEQRGKFAAYALLVKALDEKGTTDVPSYMTFTTAVNKRPKYAQARQRKGRKGAYPMEEFFWDLDRNTPRHGDRPFEIAHIDHTELPIQLVHSRTGKPLGRPWVTFLTDAYSRRILAAYLSYDHPSYRACMMACRICVQRFQRLPQTIVVDGGPEFHSQYFEALAARYRVTIKNRPGSKPRFGSVCERLFETTQSRFVYNLVGNTQIATNVRLITKENNPQLRAVWALPVFYERLLQWAYETYDTMAHATLGQSPRDQFDQAVGLTGAARHLIPYNDDFIIWTLPSTPKGTAKVMVGRGFKFHNVYYWSDEFRAPDVEGSQVPIRYDPWDCGQAYAFAHGHWVKCISEYYHLFSGRSQRELEIAAAELRQQLRLQNSSLTINARELGQFLASIKTEEVELQRLKDSDLSEVLSAIEGKILPHVGTAPSVLSKPPEQMRNEGTRKGKPSVKDLPVFEEHV